MSKKSKAAERAAKAAAALAERKRKERRRNILTAVAVVAVMALIVGAGFLFSRSSDEKADEGVSPTSAYDLAIGDEDAPHTVVIYEDYLCPICQAFEAGSREQLAQLADDGKVYVSYRPFNLFSRADDPRKGYSVAAAAAFAVVQDMSGDAVAKKFHNLLYENQPSEAGPFPDADWLVDLAVQAGADEADVREGIEKEDGTEWVEKATDEAEDADVSSTPTIFLDGEQFRDGRTMEEVVDNLVAALD